MKRSVLYLVSVILLVTLLVACQGAPSPASAPTPTPSPTPAPTPAKSGETYVFTFNWLEMFGTTHSMVVTTEPGGLLERMLYEKSGGQIQLDTKPNLITVGQSVQGVAEGTVDITMDSAPHHSQSYPILDYMSLPGIADNLFEMEAVTADPRMFKILNDTYRSIGVQYLATIYDELNNAVWAKGKIDTVEKFKGLKIRTSGAMQKSAIEKLGAAGIVMPSAEMDTALIRGTIDGIATAISFGWGRGLADIATDISFWPINSGFPVQLLMNAEKFDSLPPDLQQVVVDVFTEAASYQNFAREGQRLYALTALTRAGTEVTYPTQGEVAKCLGTLEPITDEWLKLTGSTGEQALIIMTEAVEKYRALETKLK